MWLLLLSPLKICVKHFLQAPLQSDQIKLDLPNATIPMISSEIGTKMERQVHCDDLR
jgi:hypothetical protein